MNGTEMDDWNQAGNFMNKPQRGWLHPDQKIADSGISYGVRYIGCLEVNTSMKSLDFDTRSLIAKECINKLCEAAGLKTADKKRKVDKRLLKMLSEKPNMDHAGSNVNLTITSSHLNLVTMETGDVIARHEMPKISFASGGDADTLDFVSYVAKDHRYGRACFVLECGGGLAQDVITTIGQAFELRYKQYLKRVPSIRNETETAQQASSHNGNFVPSRDDPEYYNDLPGKVPPDVVASVFLDNESIRSSSLASLAMKDINSNSQPYPVPYATTPLQKESDSLIDLTSSSPNIAVYRRPGPEYVNTTAVISNERPMDNSTKAKTVKHDIFDMQPFSANLASLQPEDNSVDSLLNTANTLIAVPSTIPKITPKMEAEKAALLEEPWFHGTITRQESEALVVKDGDFLVRESTSTPGQYVLTGMQRSQRKHLLLVDPEGVVRTKDQVFDSISHLISFHRDNCLPIISAESALLLRYPVCRTLSTSKSVQV
ncbi:SHC-transforming protein 1-like [Uloborus diversus]|uniref:SHC-transforming protein 1-like n=1 Tax=Uloborus diversus TaxID=327109 RepID=UPI0024094287|nr:SHC-transforming protein 1-like [Uloborus diversus]